MLRTLTPMASTPSVRSTASSPSVITAIENSGSPIIGRMINRSITSPSSMAKISATISALNHTTYWLSPSQRPGTRQSMSTRLSTYVPTRAIAPWAKLTVCVALKTSTKPRAMRA